MTNNYDNVITTNYKGESFNVVKDNEVVDVLPVYDWAVNQAKQIDGEVYVNLEGGEVELA